MSMPHLEVATGMYSTFCLLLLIIQRRGVEGDGVAVKNQERSEDEQKVEGGM